jgi:hypothetical protein
MMTPALCLAMMTPAAAVRLAAPRRLRAGTLRVAALRPCAAPRAGRPARARGGVAASAAGGADAEEAPPSTAATKTLFNLDSVLGVVEEPPAAAEAAQARVRPRWRRLRARALLAHPRVGCARTVSLRNAPRAALTPSARLPRPQATPLTVSLRNAPRAALTRAPLGHRQRP